MMSVLYTMTLRPKQMRKPPPLAPKIRPAAGVLSETTLKQMANQATYEGSVQHKDGMSFAGSPSPRAGATHVGAQFETPDCMLCPHKWAWKKDAATDLLRSAIERGQFDVRSGSALPQYVWARDPVDRKIVYEARRLSHPQHGYKAYPLTALQTASLEIKI
jgi:hypothetical protein